MHCGKCGNKLQEKDKFCSRCGNVIEDKTIKNTETEVKNEKANIDNIGIKTKYLNVTLIGIVILTVAVVIFTLNLYSKGYFSIKSIKSEIEAFNGSESSKTNNNSYSNEIEQNNDYLISHSNSKILTVKELKEFNFNEFKIARNEIYARYGYVFKDDDLNTYFNSCKWYKANEEYNGKLSEIEIANVELIKACEDDMKVDEFFFEYIVPISSDYVLCYDNIKDLNEEELIIAKNEIFARHGFVFYNDNDAKQYFNSKRWYSPNEQFATQLFLNDTEIENAKLIKKIEYENFHKFGKEDDETGLFKVKEIKFNGHSYDIRGCYFEMYSGDEGMKAAIEDGEELIITNGETWLGSELYNRYDYNEVVLEGNDDLEFYILENMNYKQVSLNNFINENYAGRRNNGDLNLDCKMKFLDNNVIKIEEVYYP